MCENRCSLLYIFLYRLLQTPEKPQKSHLSSSISAFYIKVMLLPLSCKYPVTKGCAKVLAKINIHKHCTR